MTGSRPALGELETGLDLPVAYVAAAWRDLGAVYRVHRACFPVPYAFWRFVGYQFSSAADIDIAVCSGRLVGYLVLNRATHFAPPRRVGEIISLGVLDGYRRRGIARSLLGQAHRKIEADGLSEALLQVSVSNQAARALYEQMGYQVVERLRRYYANGEDAWLMCRRTEPAR